MNIAFQIEVQTNAEGKREIVNVECEPTTEETSMAVGAEVIAPGSWLFDVVLPENFDERAFLQFRRFRVAPEAIHAACAQAMHATGVR